MTQRLRLLLTATALAALSVLGPAAAHATPPQHDPASQDRVSVCNSGHGQQFDCDASPVGGQPATGLTATAPAGSQLAAVIISIAAVLGLVVALATGGVWYRLRHRPREAI
jgi:hypothetical protein